MNNSDTKRFQDIEDARETFAYMNEDMHEVDLFIRAGKQTTALDLLQSMIRNLEYATKQFPEMDTELKPWAAEIAPRLLQIIRKS